MIRALLFIVVLTASVVGADGGTLASDLFAQGDYGSAAVEYLRLLHDGTAAADTAACRLNLARCYLALNRYDDVDRLASRYGTDDVRLKLLQVRGLLERDAFAAAAECAGGVDSPVARYQRGYALFRLGNTEGARQAFGVVASGDTLYERATAVAVLLDAPDGIRRKSYAAAGLLSLVPGMGHLYTGRKGDAFYAAALVLGFTGLAYVYHDNGANTRAAVAGGFGALFQASSMYGAVVGVKLWNREQRDAYLRRFEDVFRGRDGNVR